MGKARTLKDVEKIASALQPHLIRKRDKVSPLAYFFYYYFEHWFDYENFETNCFFEILKMFFRIETTEMLETISESMDAFLTTQPTEKECNIWLE